jgi:hypothetical protein
VEVLNCGLFTSSGVLKFITKVSNQIWLFEPNTKAFVSLVFFVFKKLWIRPRSSFIKKFPEPVASLAKNKDYDSLVFNIYLKKRVLFDLLPFNKVLIRKTFEDRKLRGWVSIINLALHYFCHTKYKFFLYKCVLSLPPPLSRIYFNQLKCDIHIVFTIMCSRLTF